MVGVKQKNVMDEQTRGNGVDYAGQESKADQAVDQVLSPTTVLPASPSRLSSIP